MRSHRVLFGAVALALATACTTGTPNPPSSKHQTGTVSVSQFRNAEAGTDYEILFDVEFGPGPATNSVLAVGPTGSAIVVHSTTTSLDLKQDRILVRTTTGDESLPNLKQGTGRQAWVGEVSASGKSLAWLETSSTSLMEADWELFARDSTGTVRHLASSATSGDSTAPPPLEHHPLAVDDTFAYTTVPLPRGASNTSQLAYYTTILAAPLTGKPPTTAISDARLPAIGPTGLHYVRDYASNRHAPTRSRVEFGVIGAGGTPRTLDTIDLRDDQTVTGHCVVGDNIIWVTSDDAERPKAGSITIRAADGTRTVLQLADSARAPNLSCGKDLFVWGGSSSDEGPVSDDSNDKPSASDDGMYLYSLTKKAGWKLGNNHISSLGAANGNTVVWNLPPTAGDTTYTQRVVRWLH